MAVENKALPGTPDVEYIGGWIELKWMRRWPQNADESAVLIPHFTPQQRAWLKLRWRRGGRCHLLLQVGREWQLFDGDVAAQEVGRATRQRLQAVARNTWLNGMNYEELKKCLSESLRN